MRLAYPENVWWLLVALAAIGCAGWMLYRQRQGLRAFRLVDASNASPASLTRQLVKLGLRVAALALLAVAMLGPCWGEQELRSVPAHGRDLLVVLDVSRSMATEDVAPSRIGQAKADLKSLAKGLEKRGGYRIGLIAFADRAALLCPLTTDFKHFYEELSEASLETLRLHQDGLSWHDGTQLGTALIRAERAVPKSEDGKSYCDLLVVSDGGDELDEQTRIAAEALAKRHVRVFTVGVGDPGKASPIPVVGPGNRRQLLTFQGEVVHTRLEETVLREVARQTAAAYIAAGTNPLPLDQVIHLLETEPSRELNAAGEDPIHRYEWFLLPAVLLLFMDNLIGTRSRRLADDRPGKPSRPPWLISLIPPPRRQAARIKSWKAEAAE
jgi:Ca-activated chloride channel family protein